MVAQESDITDDYANRDTPRTALEIAHRAIINHCVIARGHGVSKDDLCEWLEDEKLWDFASPKEQKLLRAAKPSKKDLTAAAWRTEAQVALLWAISKIDDLGSLSHLCATGPLVQAMPELFSSTAPFIKKAKLRNQSVIQAEYDKVYEAHEETRDAVKRGVAIPNAVDRWVIQERHYAFNWITGYCGQGWDEISTDT